MTLFEAAEPHPPETARTAIVDIGSNSIRLVVYDGPRRQPFTLFNEKVMAGLGASLARTGAIDPRAMERGIAALYRFRQLCADMEIDDIRCVATAAVRDASNGPEFLARVEEAGFTVRLLTGTQEGETSGYGVLSAIPDADGIVGDLGGGSLELIRVGQGGVRDPISMPLGVLRIGPIRAQGEAALEQAVRTQLDDAGWTRESGIWTPGLPFYLVGGSWRGLGRLHMDLTAYPLPVIHAYEMPVEAADDLVRALGELDRARLKQVPSLTGSRIPTLPDAAALLTVLARHLQSLKLVVSAYGLREGLLYAELPPAVRKQDPLLAAATLEGESQGRWPGHGALIERFVAPLFPDDSASHRRIRTAACLLADVGWRANPEFRAERGVEIALHGNWVGIDVEERAMLAQALHSNFGGGTTTAPLVRGLASPESLRRAALWGLAIRLGQRLSGGVALPLEASRLSVRDAVLTLSLPASHEHLWGEAVEKRLRQLADAMALTWRWDADAA